MQTLCSLSMLNTSTTLHNGTSARIWHVSKAEASAKIHQLPQQLPPNIFSSPHSEDTRMEVTGTTIQAQINKEGSLQSLSRILDCLLIDNLCVCDARPDLNFIGSNIHIRKQKIEDRSTKKRAAFPQSYVPVQRQQEERKDSNTSVLHKSLLPPKQAAVFQYAFSPYLALSNGSQTR